MADYSPPPPPPSPYGGGPAGEVPLSQPYPGISPVDAITRFFKKYATFEGRASRSEFWWPMLAIWVIDGILNVLGRQSTIFAIIGYIFGLAVLVPYLAVGARRLHDTGRSGWLQLLLIISCLVVPLIVLIVFWAQGPKPEGDKYNVA